MFDIRSRFWQNRIETCVNCVHAQSVRIEYYSVTLNKK